MCLCLPGSVWWNWNLQVPLHSFCHQIRWTCLYCLFRSSLLRSILHQRVLWTHSELQASSRYLQMLLCFHLIRHKDQVLLLHKRRRSGKMPADAAIHLHQAWTKVWFLHPGNPPFGHSGEKAISTYFSEGKGIALKEELSSIEWDDLIHFEGNANAFRLLTHQFEGRRKGGFVMTYSTLASIVKYVRSA